MIQDFTLHTHTLGFDGCSTVAEMVSRAKELNMSAIGISNHFIFHPEIQLANFYTHAASRGYQSIYQRSFADIVLKYRAHYAEIERVASNSSIPVLRGIEVDYFDSPDWYRGFSNAIKILRPDYMIGAVHFIEHNGKLCNVHDIANADSATQDKMLLKYWRQVCRASSTGLFTWMAHLDLPKKCLLGRDFRWAEVECDVIETLARNRTAIEINTGLYRPDCYEPYPSPRIMDMIAVAKLPVVFSDDAHAVDQIGRHFSDACQLATECGIKNRLSLQKILDFSKKTL